MPNSVWSPQVQATIDGAKMQGLFPSPADWRDTWMYFLLVDRFANPNAPARHVPFDDPGYSDYQGGTYAGVQAQLPYLKRLGARAIWLGPVLQNVPADPTYHGYGFQDVLSAERRFATDPRRADDELRALVDAAHREGLYVIFDIVLNHAGRVFDYPGFGSEAPFSASPRRVAWRDAGGAARPDWDAAEHIANPSSDAVVWPRELQNNARFRRQGGPQAGGDDTIGDFASLRQLRTDDGEVQRTLIRAYQYVIARFDADGFRIDTLRYLKGDLHRIFGNAMREFGLSVGKKNFFTFGEVWSSEERIAQFIGRTTHDSSELVGVDAALDYPLFYALRAFAKGFGSPQDVAAMYQRRKTVEADILSSHGDATRFFVTFLDNHDVKERLRYADPGEAHRYDDQVTLGITSLLTLPGIPCIYYGTEQGLHGRGNDEAVREALWSGPGFDPANPFYAEIARVTAVRDSRPSLRYGRFYFRPLSGNGHEFGLWQSAPGVLAYSRILNDEETLVVLNADTQQSHHVHVIVDASLNAAGAPFTVLYSNKPAAAHPAPAVTAIAAATVHEPDGTTSTGTVNAIELTIAPMEAMILIPNTPGR